MLAGVTGCLIGAALLWAALASTGGYYEYRLGNPPPDQVLADLTTTPTPPLLPAPGASAGAPISPGDLWNYGQTVGGVGAQTFLPPTLDRATGVNLDFPRAGLAQVLNPFFLPSVLIVLVIVLKKAKNRPGSSK